MKWPVEAAAPCQERAVAAVVTCQGEEGRRELEQEACRHSLGLRSQHLHWRWLAEVEAQQVFEKKT